MKLKQKITLTNITKWCVILVATTSLTMSDLNIYLKCFYILSFNLATFYLFAIDLAHTKLQDRINSFVMFPLEMSRAGKKYKYQGNLSVKELPEGFIDVSDFDLTLITEIEGDKYQGFYKEIKETNE
jgi:hypothetical protein